MNCDFPSGLYHFAMHWCGQRRCLLICRRVSMHQYALVCPTPCSGPFSCHVQQLARNLQTSLCNTLLVHVCRDRELRDGRNCDRHHQGQLWPVCDPQRCDGELRPRHCGSLMAAPHSVVGPETHPCQRPASLKLMSCFICDGPAKGTHGVPQKGPAEALLAAACRAPGYLAPCVVPHPCHSLMVL